MNVNDIWMEFHLMKVKKKYCYMQWDENLVYMNNGVNGQQIDVIHMGYHQTGSVYIRRSGSVQIHPDRPPISVRARIGSNSNKQLQEIA